jgi:Transposase zinc-ribbon domain
VPGAGREYPRTLDEFNNWFRSDEDCRAFLERLRWPDGFRCSCDGGKAWRVRRNRLRCSECERETSVIAWGSLTRSRCKSAESDGMRITTGWSLNDPTAANAVTAERPLSPMAVSFTHRA